MQLCSLDCHSYKSFAVMQLCSLDCHSYKSFAVMQLCSLDYHSYKSYAVMQFGLPCRALRNIQSDALSLSKCSRYKVFCLLNY